MMEMVRTFVAAELSPSFRRELVNIQAGLSDLRFNVRWVKPENIHLTLAFLGDVHPEILDNVHLAVAAAAGQYSAIHLSADGLGVFPGVTRPRVIWAGLSGEVETLAALRTTLESGLTRVRGLAYKIEKRPFRAHLTLGRVRNRIRGRSKGQVRVESRIDGRKLAAAMDRLRPLASAPLTVNELAVFKSELRPTGAEYTKLKGILLAGH